MNKIYYIVYNNESKKTYELMTLKYFKFITTFSDGNNMTIDMSNKKCIIVGISIRSNTLNPVCLPYIYIYKKILKNDSLLKIAPMDIIKNNMYLYLGEDINGEPYDYKPPHILLLPSKLSNNKSVLPIHTCLYSNVLISIRFPDEYKDIVSPDLRSKGYVTVQYAMFI